VQELPVLDETRCVGCGDCVAACPVDCLAMAGPEPWLLRPGDCISCALCVLICPTQALELQDPEPSE
jgi:NAD-dependent dihydropyrimidine dehydrogenase PreA subunit